MDETADTITADTITADTIIDATLSLLAQRPFSEVTVLDIAREAGVSLAVLNHHFATRHAILRAFSRRIDGIVLAADMSDMADESPRDRLFDVLMTRLDALRPYREALRSLLRSARRDPQLALALNAVALNSQSWMLAAAGLSATGWRGRLAVQSLVATFAKVLRVFLAEDDAGLPRTMATLDQELKALEGRHNRLARLFGHALTPDAGPAERAPEQPAPARPMPDAPDPPQDAPPPPPPPAAKPAPKQAAAKRPARKASVVAGRRTTAPKSKKPGPKRSPIKKDEADDT